MKRLSVLLLAVLAGISSLFMGCDGFFTEESQDNGVDVTKDYRVVDPSASAFEVLSAIRWGDTVGIKIGLKKDQSVPAVDTDIFNPAGAAVPATDGNFSFIEINLRQPAFLGQSISVVQLNDALNLYYGREIWLDPAYAGGDGSVHGDGPVFSKTKNYGSAANPNDEPTEYLIAEKSPTHKFEVKFSYDDIVKTFLIDYSAVTW